jgi:predicted RNase H-like HicB family nuclease
MSERLRQLEFTAVYRKVPEGYIAFLEELPGANTQGRTLEEARINLREAAQLVLEANRALACRTLTRTASSVSLFGSLRSEASGACPTSRAAWLPSVARR